MLLTSGVVSLLGVDCIIDHQKFDVVCLDPDVLATALVAIHNARNTPQPDTMENRYVKLIGSLQSS